MGDRDTASIVYQDQSGSEIALVGYRIPYVPDFLASPHRFGDTDQQRLGEVLAQQTRLVANLWEWGKSAFALRYLYRGGTGIELGCIGRILAPPGQGQTAGLRLGRGLGKLLETFGYPVRQLSGQDVELFLHPFSNPSVAEVRQHEDQVPLFFAERSAYLVYPFHPSNSTWIPVFESILRRGTPCMISIHLEPTTIGEGGRLELASVAKLAETLSEQDLSGHTLRLQARDPHARVVSRLYADLFVRLSRPYLLVVQVVSHEADCARAVAQVLGAEITTTTHLAEATREDSPLPAGFDVVSPGNLDERDAALGTLRTLRLQRWGPTVAPSDYKRLRYLADAHRASAAFRFPIAVRGGIPGIKVVQPLPAFEVVPEGSSTDSILLGAFAGRGGDVWLPLRAINRHVLVAGTTGAGKTTTCTRLLAELWERGIPSLVIEPTKTEYRVLLEADIGSDLQVFTLGDEMVSPFRLNPLEVMPGVRVERHISHIKAALTAALPTFGILPSLVEETLYRVYSRKGWRFSEEPSPQDSRSMPTLGELYGGILQVAEERGYQDRTMQDVRAAASGRIKPFLLGSKGQMLNVRRSIPMGALMDRPTILELGALNDEEKALVMIFLLIRLHEFVRTAERRRQLSHVTFVEEAHRVMAKTSAPSDPEVEPATGSAAVGMFAAMLSEIRAYGEGMIVAEQIPRRLADDAIKNTNVKIVHQLPGEDDRRAVGAAMGLGEEQEPYVGKLTPGYAAFFTEGYQKPTFVHVKKYPEGSDLPDRVGDEAVRSHMSAFHAHQANQSLPLLNCGFCKAQCEYRDRIALVAYEQTNRRLFRRGIFEFERLREEGEISSAWHQLVRICRQALQPIGLEDSLEAALCYFFHMWPHPLHQKGVDCFKEVYRRTIG